MNSLLLPRPLPAGLCAVLAMLAPCLRAAEDTASANTTLTRLRSVLPPFHATARPPAPAPVAVAILRTPIIVLAPRETVQASVVRRLNEESRVRRGVYDRQLVKRELSRFDRFFLNRITLPLGGVPLEIRARQAWLDRHTADFHAEIEQFARVVQSSDPRAAAALRECRWSWP